MLFSNLQNENNFIYLLILHESKEKTRENTSEKKKQRKHKVIINQNTFSMLKYAKILMLVQKPTSVSLNHRRLFSTALG